MNPYLELAKSAVENYIKEGKIIEPPENLPEEFFKKRAGVFVTIENQKRLRGCIGTYLPTKKNIAQEIIDNAISAATRDFRFEPITPEELPFLSYTVYILNPPELVTKINSSVEFSEENLRQKGLDPKKYGILVRSGLKTGLLLPDLEGVDTIEKQISIACQKAGINPQTEKIEIYKFTVKKYE